MFSKQNKKTCAPTFGYLYAHLVLTLLLCIFASAGVNAQDVNLRLSPSERARLSRADSSKNKAIVNPAGTKTPIPTNPTNTVRKPIVTYGMPVHHSAFEQLLLKKMSPQFHEIIKNPNKYKLQIIFTQVNRYKNNRPALKHYTLHLDTNQYFYPASLIKLPAAVMSLERINELNIPGFTKYSKVIVGRGGSCQVGDYGNPAYPGGYSSIAQYIKTALVVSDNYTFDHLYEFNGQQYLHEQLWGKGYRSIRLLHRLGSVCSPEENRVTNPMTFYNKDSIVYQQPTLSNPYIYKNTGTGLLLGKSQILMDGRLSNTPADFTYRNYISLKDAHEMLISIMMPAATTRSKRFNLTPEDYKFLHKYLSMYPGEMRNPSYDPKEYWDTKFKYLYYGMDANAEINPNLRIFNKVGMAIGFVTDVAYFVDFETKTEFFLSATMYVNKSDIAFGGVYEFESVALPFFKELGKVMYNFERVRLKNFTPKLTFYKHNYEQ